MVNDFPYVPDSHRFADSKDMQLHCVETQVVCPSHGTDLKHIVLSDAGFFKFESHLRTFKSY